VLDTTCGECGADQAFRPSFERAVAATPPAPGIPAAPATVPATEASPTARRARSTRSTKVLAIVAAVGLVATIGLGASRLQVGTRLAASQAELRDTTASLSGQVGDLEQRVHEQEVAQAQLHNELDTANGEVADTRESLAACQAVFRISVGSSPSPALIARIQSKLNSCFQGKVPASVYG
jgi:uncharacterized protein HemX